MLVSEAATASSETGGHRAGRHSHDAAQLSQLAGCRRDSNRDTATHDATHGHQNHDERVDIVTDEMSQAHGKVVGLVLNGAQPKRKAS